MEALKYSVHYFLQHQRVYNLIPISGQVLVLQKSLSLLDVIQLILSHRQDSAVIWNSDSSCFIGNLSSTDLLGIITSQYTQDDMQLDSDGLVSKLKDQSLQDWLWEYHRQALVSVDPDDSLLTAVQVLKGLKISRLPVLDNTQSLVVGILSIDSLFKYFVDTFSEISVFEQTSIIQHIGTWNQIVTCRNSQSLIEVLRTLSKFYLSSIPLVDESGQVTGILYRSDIPMIISSQLYLSPGVDIGTVLDQVNDSDDMGLSRIGFFCEDDNAKSIVEKLAAAPAKKLLRLENNVIQQIITAGDFLRFFNK